MRLESRCERNGKILRHWRPAWPPGGSCPLEWKSPVTLPQRDCIAIDKATLTIARCISIHFELKYCNTILYSNIYSSNAGAIWLVARVCCHVAIYCDIRPCESLTRREPLQPRAFGRPPKPFVAKLRIHAKLAANPSVQGGHPDDHRMHSRGGAQLLRTRLRVGSNCMLVRNHCNAGELQGKVA